MSGPKVVRIVTREELIDICEGHLARVDVAIAQWTRIGRRNECIDENDIVELEARRAALRAMLATENFMDLQKEAPREIIFLEQDMERRLADISARAATARSIERRQARAARALLVELGKAGLDPSPALRDALERAAQGVPDPVAMSDGFALLSQRSANDDAAAGALAARHSEGLSRLTFAAWLDAQPEQADPALARLDAKLAELDLFGSSQSTHFEARLREIEGEGNLRRRRLLLDSLNVELGRAAADTRARQKARARVLQAKAEIELLDPAVWAPFAERLDEEATLAALEALLTEAEAALATARADKAVALRREALLESLNALGYEVTEGLETAWAQDGTLVVRHTERPDHGMEIGGDFTSGRAQMRAVAFRSGEASQGDEGRRVESLWCDDVARLQEELACSDGGLTIERASPAGAVPLRVVARPARGVRRQAREGRRRDLKSLQ